MHALLSGNDVDVLVTAHVHLQFVRQVAGVRSMNAGSAGLPYGATPAAYWAELGPEITFQAARRTTSMRPSVGPRQSGIPMADRLVGLLREPPSEEEIIADGERLEVSD